MSGAQYDICVIGGGVAGLAAAGYAAAAGASTACFESAALYGGLIANVGRLDGFPPAAAPIAGATLADAMLTRARAAGAEFRTETVAAIAPGEQGVRLATASGEVSAQACIIATGARLRRLAVPGEREFAGRGVSQCDWCDGGLYRGRRVAVVGGGNAAVQAALHLAELCESVTMVVRGAALTARRDYVLRAADHPAIEFLWETVVDQIIGTSGVEALRLRQIGENSIATRPFAALFVFCGVVPATETATAAIARAPDGGILTDGGFRSSAANVFAAGAVRSGTSGTLAGAMGEGEAAAAAAVAHLRRLGSRGL